MKTIQLLPLKHFGTAIAAFGLLVALSAAQAQDPKTPAQGTNNNQTGGNDDDKAKIKIKDGEGGKVKIKGQAARDLLKPEITSTWVQGYTVPKEYHQHFIEVPRAQQDNVVVRYYGGRAYYVNRNDWTISRVVEVDPRYEATAETSAFVEGSVIPDSWRTRFVEVPNPDTGLTIRYYGDTAYYMDPQYRIVRTVPLATR